MLMIVAQVVCEKREYGEMKSIQPTSDRKPVIRTILFKKSISNISDMRTSACNP